MAQPEKNLSYTMVKVPPFLNSARKPEMTVKRYRSRFKSYLLLTHKIRIDPLITKQKDAAEKKQELCKEEDKDNLEMALEDFKWVMGQETEKHLMKAHPKTKVQDRPLYEYKKNLGGRIESR